MPISCKITRLAPFYFYWPGLLQAPQTVETKPDPGGVPAPPGGSVWPLLAGPRVCVRVRPWVLGGGAQAFPQTPKPRREFQVNSKAGMTGASWRGGDFPNPSFVARQAQGGRKASLRGGPPLQGQQHPPPCGAIPGGHGRATWALGRGKELGLALSPSHQGHFQGHHDPSMTQSACLCAQETAGHVGSPWFHRDCHQELEWKHLISRESFPGKLSGLGGAAI